MATLTLCMIVKNEEEVLARCLDSVRGLADEIVIVDTGSTDSTIDIARRYGASIHHFEWIDDFAAARNFSFAQATSEYILWLDADDVILPEELAKLLELKQRLENDIYLLYYDYFQDASGNPLCTMYRERIIRRGLDGAWEYPVHECFSQKEGNSVEKVPITITHRRTEAGGAADEGRNLRILEKAIEREEYRSNARITYYLAKEYLDTANEPKAIEMFRRFLDLPDGWIEDRFGAQLRIARACHTLSKKEPERASEHRAAARREAEKAVAIDDRWAESYFLLGQIAYDEGRIEEAIARFEEAIRPTPPVLTPVEFYYYKLGPSIQLVFCHDKLGRFEKANEYNELALEVIPDDPALLRNRDYFRQRIRETHPEAGKVDIIIPTYNNPGYLRLCLESIAACTTHPHRIIVVNSGDPSNVEGLPFRVTVVQSESRLSFAQAVNLGIAGSSAPYVCLLNDDVIVSKGWLEPLVETVRGNVGICNPLSNNDKGWLHDHDLTIDGVELLPGGNVLRDGMIRKREGDSDSPGIPPHRLHTARFPHDMVRRCPWVPFFCTLLSRTMIEKLGRIDEGFINGVEDVDYCRRAWRMGYASCIDERSFVFHFGSVSRNAGESETPGRIWMEDQGNHARFSSKYDRPLLAIHTGYAYERWTSANIDAQGIGGSETAAARMAEELAAIGYRTVVFSPCEGMEGTYNGVEYIDTARFPGFIDTHHCDVFIASRYIQILTNHTIRAMKRYLWLHDIQAIGTEPGENDLVRRYYDQLDGIFCLSPWHMERVMEIHGVPREKLILTGNGIDISRFEREIPKQPNRFIYSSCPTRGLDVLLSLFPTIREMIRDAELHIYHGFDTWDMAIARRNDPREKAWRDQIHALMNQPGVFAHGRIGQGELAEEFLRSDIWFFPTYTKETYCITAVEAQMAGTLCICSDIGALGTTVADRGILLSGDSRTPAYRMQALHRIAEIAANPEWKKTLTVRARAWAMQQTWRNRAREWAALFATPGITLGDMPAD